MATKTPGGKIQAGKGIAHLFPSHHETLKRSDREGGKALEKVADRAVVESLENSIEDEPLCKFDGAVVFNVFITLRT